MDCCKIHVSAGKQKQNHINVCEDLQDKVQTECCTFKHHHRQRNIGLQVWPCKVFSVEEPIIYVSKMAIQVWPNLRSIPMFLNILETMHHALLPCSQTVNTKFLFRCSVVSMRWYAVKSLSGVLETMFPSWKRPCALWFVCASIAAKLAWQVCHFLHTPLALKGRSGDITV